MPLVCIFLSKSESKVNKYFDFSTLLLDNLRHCATSRKVTGSIPDGVIGIFHWHNPSGRTMALGVDSTSNRNEYQQYFLGGKGGRCVGLTTLPHSCADCLEIWEPQTPGTLSGPVQAWNGIDLPLPYMRHSAESQDRNSCYVPTK